MKAAKILVGILVLVACATVFTGVALSEEPGEEASWTTGTITEFVEGESLTVAVPGEKDGEETSVTFTLTEETEFYEKVEAGEVVDVEHKENTALYVQITEDK